MNQEKKMKPLENENFTSNKVFEEYAFGININLTKSELISTDWVDPFDSVWLKVATTVVYAVEVLASVIMMAFVVYETNGYNGHFRTLINQLLSHLYGGVGYILLILKH